jgi:hypothetical protein
MSWSNSLAGYLGEFSLVRLLIQRGLAAVYFVAFLNALNQFKPLLGERGLLPAADYVARVSFREAPSLFHWGASDRCFGIVAWSGLVLSVLGLTGLSERGPFWLSLLIWLCLYILYLSIVNVGQAFYAFGWESMLLEAGFLAAFLGPAEISPPAIPVLALRWLLFRVELGAGLIKLRHDRCWRDLTCLYFHHETQPIPNPLSRTFHGFPRRVLRYSVLFSHWVQLVCPFGLFAPQPVASVAATFIIVHQLLLILSGNYAWLNWLTIVLGFSGFSDGVLATVLPPLATESPSARPLPYEVTLYALGAAILLLSIRPTLNLLSKNQAMNKSYNSLHLVGSYGAFGSVTRERYEVVIEATSDSLLSDQTSFREYEFKGKPGDPYRRPRQWAPYHLRLDWLMWFLPLRMPSKRPELVPLRYERWFMCLIEKLLRADRRVLSALQSAPFAAQAPKYVRASLYRYEFSNRREQKQFGLVWKRTRIGEYLPPVSLETLGGAAPPSLASAPKRHTPVRHASRRATE